MQTPTQTARRLLRFPRVAYIGIGVIALITIVITGIALSRPAGDLDTLSPMGSVPPVVVPRTSFVGDSYTQGVGASSPSARWVTRVSLAEGWEPENLGQGGTGYVTSAGAAACGLEYCPTYAEVVARVIESRPDIVVVAGGMSDFAVFQEDSVRVVDAISSIYVSLRAGLPEAEIIAIGPYTPQPPGATAKEFDRAVSQAASNIDARFVSLLDPPLFDQSFVLPDGIQLSDAGHAAIAQRIEESLDL